MLSLVKKPWGHYEDYYRSNNVVFKIICVEPNETLSYQSHNDRGEFWYIIQGKGFVVLNDTTHLVETGHHINIPKCEKHRVGNYGPEKLLIAEMQFGQCREDDIIRYQDNYGR